MTSFDIIYLDGFNLTKTPLRQRKLLLENVCKANSSRSLIRFSQHFEGSGEAFFRQACEYGIEGIVSKPADSPDESTRVKLVEDQMRQGARVRNRRLHAVVKRVYPVSAP